MRNFRLHISSAATIALTCIVPQLASGQNKAAVKGAIFTEVLDAAGDPLPGAEILLPTLDVKFNVSSGGSFLLRDVPAGMYVIQARRVGYAIQSRVVRVAADTASVKFLLAPVSQSLDTVKVTADALAWFSDFDANRKRGQGQFYTRSDITQSGTLNMSQFIRRARGIRVIPGKSALTPDVVTATRCAMGTNVGPVVVFLDGMEISQSPDFDINVVPNSMIAAVEVYNDIATIPAKFRTNHDRCGTILLWTS